MSDKDVDILEQKTVYDGYFRIDQYRLRHSLFAGGMGGEIMRELFERGHAVAILPYDPKADALVMIEQFRIGAHAAGWNPWLLEIPAGIVEEEETTRGVAEREMIEETGCKITDLSPICNYLVSPGGTSETLEIFYGKVDSTKAGGIHGLDHEGEDIKVTVIPTDEALAKLNQGEINNSMTIIALQWLALNREKLRG